MNVSEVRQTFGKTFARGYDAAVLHIGTTTFTRQDLIHKLGIDNRTAARRLSATLRTLRVTTIDQLANIGPESLYRVHGCGDVQVFVAMCLLEWAGHDVHAWWGWDTIGATVAKHAREKRAQGAHETPLPPLVEIRHA